MKNLKKQIAISSSSLLLTLSVLSAPALAGNSGDGSEYGTQPGFAVSGSQTDCYGHGAFGYFGKNNNLGIKSDPADPGANGEQTGLNNSALCGNRQGNLP